MICQELPTFSLFCVSQCSSECMYGCSCVEHVSALLCVDVSVMLSAYEDNCMLSGVCGTYVMHVEVEKCR